jgi:hypothetical protein
MTAWHPQVVIVGVRCAHVYLVPDNGSLSALQTVEWTGEVNPSAGIAFALKQLFRQVDVPEPEDVHGLAQSLWASLDRRKRTPPTV